MEKRRRLSVALLAVVVGTVSGCAGSAPFGRLGARHSHDSSLSQPTGAASATSTWSGSGTADQTPPLGQSAVEKKTFGSTVTTAFQTAGEKISNALTIRPKVIPAEDPVNLSSKPDRVSAEVFVSTARLFESQGDMATAAVQYEKALQVEPGDLEALVGHARLLDRQGDLDRAIQLYEKATATNSQSAIAFNDLGLCHARQGNFAESLRALTRAVKLQPDNKLYRNNLATVYVETDRLDEAFDHLTAVHGPAVAHYNLGYLLHKRDDRQSAIGQFTLALQMDPSLKAAQVMLDRLQVAASPASDQTYRISDNNASADPAVENTSRVDEPSAPQPTVHDQQIDVVDAATQEAPNRDFPELPPEPEATDRATSFPMTLPPVESSETSPVEYPTIHLPKVGSYQWRDEQAPEPPTPDEFASATLAGDLSSPVSYQ